jgi:hypothetical protein
MAKTPLSEFEILFNDTQIDPRLKHLWLEIYRNALYDREQVSIFLTSMTSELNENAQTHVAYGAQASKYMELARKSNEQLLKLAEQIRLYNEDEGEIDSDNILNEIDAAGRH